MDISKYLEKLQNSSSDFKHFLNEYADKRYAYRLEGEEYTVWNKIKGEELQIAKQIVIENLHTLDYAFVRAIRHFGTGEGTDELQDGPEILGYIRI